MNNVTRIFGLLIAGLGLSSACDANGDELTFHQVVDPGMACVEPTEDQRVAVLITETCITGSHIDLEAHCDVDVSEKVIEVDALYEYETPEHVTLDCQNVTTRCVSEQPVASGGYLLAYGDQLVAVDIPPAGDEPHMSTCTEPPTDNEQGDEDDL